MQTLMEEENILDITLIEPRLKHPTIFARFDELVSGESLILHNDHDPKPLYYELSAERGDIFTWQYLGQGPELWRVKITKNKKEEQDQEPEILDATLLHPSIKHATIFNRFDALNPGESFILHNDHDPRPLRFQLENLKGNVFTWEYLEQGPELFRIKIAKKKDAEGKEEDKILDATLLHPSIKHATIFNRFDALNPGESFILHNDHDPRPLRFQLENLKGNVFTWEYLEQGPDLFRIKITKNKLTNSAPEKATKKGDENILKVTEIEPRLKHPTVFVRFDELNPGESLTIHNDHDPKPLYYQLLGERGDIFTWEYLEQGPQLWRIKIAKRPEGAKEETLGEIAVKDLRKAQVFKKYGLDFCCGGKKTVKEACAEKGLDVTKIEQELQTADKNIAATRPLPYNDWNLDFLADYIVNTHHSYVKKTIPDLRNYSEKVAKVHGGHHPELFRINQLVQEVCDEMSEHMVKEENVLFPYVKHIVKTNGDIKFDSLDTVQEPIDIAVTEHVLVGGNMEQIRELSHNYELPEDGCASYSFLFKTLNEFEDDLHIHIHLENNILFPKALEMEKK